MKLDFKLYTATGAKFYSDVFKSLSGFFSLIASESAYAVCIYTGFVDKYKHKIYQYDVVDYNGHSGDVIFHNGSWVVSVEDAQHLLFDIYEELVLAGNIYEKSE